MNEGGSVLGGSQPTSGGADAPILNPQNSNQLQPQPQPQTSTPTQSPEPTPSPSETSYEQEFLNSLDPNNVSFTDSASKKSHKAIILAALTAIVLIIVLSVAAFLSSSNSPAAPTIPAIAQRQTTPSSLFNSYANDLLYGTDSTDPIGDPEDPHYYNYERYIYNGSGSDQAYIDQISEKFNTFYDSLPSSGTELYDAATDYKQLLEFIKINPSSDDYSYENIFDIYSKRGISNARKEAERLIAAIPEDNPYSSEFAESKKQELDSAVLYLMDINSSECLENRELDEECFSDFISEKYDPDEEKPYVTMMRSNSDAHNALDDIYKQLADKCWQIKNILEGNN